MFSSVAASYSVQALAEALGYSPKSIYNSLCAIKKGEEPPESLPPFFYRPGSNRPIFVHVAGWIDAQVERQNQILGRSYSSSSPTPTATKKRGRKTNKEKAELARGGEK